MNKLLIASLCCSLAGVFIILYIGENYQPGGFYIKEINETFLDKYIKVGGTAEKVFTGKGITIVDLKDSSGWIKVVAFSNMTGIKKGMRLEVVGIVKEYEDELEIIAEEIKVV
ncbi:MAG: OB-fold nucleic acid binding domain-containing protein [Candidatus Woesearchaeota archaeon]|nr:MAG: OB-fold nucleic acid binding domain-containing protein [Candidatus Woesearchaeota archaeon]